MPETIVWAADVIESTLVTSNVMAHTLQGTVSTPKRATENRVGMMMVGAADEMQLDVWYGEGKIAEVQKMHPGHRLPILP